MPYVISWPFVHTTYSPLVHFRLESVQIFNYLFCFDHSIGLLGPILTSVPGKWYPVQRYLRDIYRLSTYDSQRVK